MQRYKKFTDMSISVPDTIDNNYHKNKKDNNMTAETAAPSTDNKDYNERNSKKRDSLLSSSET
jgi:hypothetical protein